MPPSISEMIRAHQDRTGESLQRVSDRSHDITGNRVTQRYLHDLRHGRAKSWPKTGAAIVAMAEGLETTPLAVVLGFAAELLPPGSIRTSVVASRIPPAIDQVPERVQDAIVELARAVTTGEPRARRLSDDTVPVIGQDDGLHGDPGSNPGAHVQA